MFLNWLWMTLNISLKEILSLLAGLTLRNYKVIWCEVAFADVASSIVINSADLRTDLNHEFHIIGVLLIVVGNAFSIQDMILISLKLPRWVGDTSIG